MRIPKGTLVASGREVKITARAYVVTVHHVLSGMSRADKTTPPMVVWAGVGRYWHEADMNDVVKVP